MAHILHNQLTIFNCLTCQPLPTQDYSPTKWIITTPSGIFHEKPMEFSRTAERFSASTEPKGSPQVFTHPSLHSLLSQFKPVHPTYVSSKLILSPTYVLVSQLLSSLQTLTPQISQLSYAYYMSCQCHPCSLDHPNTSYLSCVWIYPLQHFTGTVKQENHI